MTTHKQPAIGTTHLSGSWMFPYNWSKIMPNDPRYGTDKPTEQDITNYDQIYIYRTETGAPYCRIFYTKHDSSGGWYPG